MKSVSSEVRRARPLLGTFVDITAQSAGEAELHCAIDRAFAAIECVHRLMSFHHPQSDVSRINQNGFPKGTIVHPWTWQVLKAAQQFARESDGVFDITVGSLLTESNHLPRAGHRLNCKATWRDIFLRKNCEVFCRVPVVIDLGGIAKGFAVDCAVENLQRAGVSSGIVNAGGDLRAFGSTSREIYLRNPISPTQFSGKLCLRNRAVATSATYFAPGALIDGQARRAMSDLVSVTIAARDCLTSDALTKIVFSWREKAAPLLKRYRADALILEHDGSPAWTFQSHAA
jgi:thiamine biosynthesis lipoprotein